MVHKQVNARRYKKHTRHRSGFAVEQEIWGDRHIPRKFRSRDYPFTSLGPVGLCLFGIHLDQMGNRPFTPNHKEGKYLANAGG
jgi:hypothetical protein